MVDNFNAVRAAVLPDKTRSPWVVDAHTVVVFTISLERLRAVVWWNAQIVQLDDGV